MGTNMIILCVFLVVFNIVYSIYIGKHYSNVVTKLRRKNASLMVELNNRYGQFTTVSRNLDTVQEQLTNTLRELRVPTTPHNKEVLSRLGKIINRITYYINVTKDISS